MFTVVSKIESQESRLFESQQIEKARNNPWKRLELHSPTPSLKRHYIARDTFQSIINDYLGLGKLEVRYVTHFLNIFCKKGRGGLV